MLHAANAIADNQSALLPQGSPASSIASLFTAMLVVAAIILAAVLIMLGIGLVKARRQQAAQPLTYTQSRNLVLLSGVVIPIIILLSFTLSSAAVNRVVAVDLPDDALTIEVIGHQWWWEVNYLDAKQNHVARTANEMHIPAGEPVRLLLKSADVIHSFWVPNLNGKTDLIPGKTNTSWIEADKPGVFRGQCGEFCGRQHARMAFTVHSRPAAEFQQWLAHQREPAREPTEAAQIRGQQVFLSSACIMCHSIRGTTALSGVAPDLTHLASRQTLAAGTMPNTRGHLSAWISAPQAIKPGNHMPAVPLTTEEFSDLVEYLLSLE
jgi:cytochrome c oxidase subunit 2